MHVNTSMAKTIKEKYLEKQILLLRIVIAILFLGMASSVFLSVMVYRQTEKQIAEVEAKVLNLASALNTEKQEKQHQNELLDTLQKHIKKLDSQIVQLERRKPQVNYYYLVKE